jgi:hypothetical protein
MKLSVPINFALVCRSHLNDPDPFDDCDFISCGGGARPGDMHLVSTVHCTNKEIVNGWSAVNDAGAPQGVARVPELTAIADIKPNWQCSLRRCKDRIR